MKAREIIEALEAELMRAGISCWSVDMGSKHWKLRFRFAGRPRAVVIAATPSDHRARRNAVRGLRRIIGLPKRNAPRHRPKKKPAPEPRVAAPELAPLPPRPDPFDKLRRMTGSRDDGVR